MVEFKNSMAGPAVILVAICLVVSFVLAFTYQTTSQVIAKNEAAAAGEVLALVLPGAGSFTAVTNVALPSGVTQAFVADNGADYVFRSAATGYSGPVTFYIGIDAQGRFAGITMFDHNETPGLGTKVGEADYLARFYGSNDPDSVDSIAGATITSNALKTALRQALEAYSIIKGAA